MKLRSIEDCARMTKGEIAGESYPGQTYDCAIPHYLWGTLQQAAGEAALGQVVMGYHPKTGCSGILLPLTREMAEALLGLSDDRLSTLMNWECFGLDWISQKGPAPGVTVGQYLEGHTLKTLREFCNWNDNYNVPEAWEEATRERIVQYWIDEDVSIPVLDDVMNRFFQATKEAHNGSV